MSTAYPDVDPRSALGIALGLRLMKRAEAYAKSVDRDVVELTIDLVTAALDEREAPKPAATEPR